MVHDKTEVTELEAKALQVVERLDTDVDVDLLSKTIVSVVGDKYHDHPIIAGVTRNLFRATTIYNIHNFCISCRVCEGQANACRTRQKGNDFIGEKRRCDFSSAGLSLRFRPRSIPSRDYKKKYTGERYLNPWTSSTGYD
jgi:hypothetical protein